MPANTCALCGAYFVTKKTEQFCKDCVKDEGKHVPVKGAAQIAYNIELRDLFALHSIPIAYDWLKESIQANRIDRDIDHGPLLAQFAYKTADYMMEARKK